MIVAVGNRDVDSDSGRVFMGGDDIYRIILKG